jgi:hypothetical protein
MKCFQYKCASADQTGNQRDYPCLQIGEGSTMIFYFTSTGNSLYAAKKFDNDLYSIPQEMKKEKRICYVKANVKCQFRIDSISFLCC